jgi:tRNA modification GTPase
MPPSSAQVDLTQTICAIATPPGRGGLGIVRLSGRGAIAIADRVFRGHDRLQDQPGYTVHYGFAVDPRTGTEIDEVLATVFRSPKSFTGEDLVEFSAHGGQMILRQIVDTLVASGAVAAQPGEFTLRAFLNGRIDLTEAEAVADLIAAKTEESSAAALRQLKGRLREEILTLRSELVAVLARLEIGIDFTEEEIEHGEIAAVRDRLESVRSRVSRLLESHRRGRVLREGFTVVLAGPPNSGKSTLFNFLAQDERAIVTDIPGTTRDILKEYINLNGWPVCIVDTAGMRDSTDVVERIGVERAAQAVGGADGVIWLIDSTINWKDQIPSPELLGESTPWVVCCNKTDLQFTPPVIPHVLAAVNRRASPATGGPPVLEISARTGAGVDELLNVVSGWISRMGIVESAQGVAINDRHRRALVVADASLRSALETVAHDGGLELVAFDAKNAAVALGEIIGETTTDDVLDEVFRNFCIGK